MNINHPYRATGNLKSEVEELKKTFEEEQERNFQNKLSELEQNIKKCARKGDKYFVVDVDTSEVRNWFLFWPRVKNGTNAYRIVEKLKELGFEPEADKWGPDDWCSSGACIRVKI